MEQPRENHPALIGGTDRESNDPRPVALTGHLDAAPPTIHRHIVLRLPRSVRCPDEHFRRAIFDLGPIIADYPEQVMLAGIVSGWCPKYYASFFLWVVLNFELSVHCRCYSFPYELDKSPGTLRDPEHTCWLMREFDPGILWTNHGIDASCVVS